MKAPDTTEPLLGYRFFSLDGDELISPWWRRPAQRFAPGPNRAYCDLPPRSLRAWLEQGHGHPADDPVPSPACGCGLYATHEPELLELVQAPAAPLVYAVVRVWGAVEVYHHGLRAEWMEIVCLLYRSSAEAELLRPIARRYQVALLGLDQLQLDPAWGRPVSGQILPNDQPAPAFTRRLGRVSRVLGLTLGCLIIGLAGQQFWPPLQLVGPFIMLSVLLSLMIGHGEIDASGRLRRWARLRRALGLTKR